MSVSFTKSVFAALVLSAAALWSGCSDRQRIEPVAPELVGKVSTAATISTEFEVAPAVELGFAAQASPLNSRVNRSVAAAFDGTNYLVAWYDDRAFTSSIMVARVSASGELLDRTGVPVANVSRQPRFDRDDPLRSIGVVAGTGDFLVVWRDNYIAPGQASTAGVRVRSNGELVDRTPLSLGSLLDDGLQAMPIVSLGNSFMMLSQTVSQRDALRIDLVTIEGIDSAKTPVVNVLPSTAEGAINRFRLGAVGSDALIVYELYTPGDAGNFDEVTMALRANVTGQVGQPFSIGLVVNQLNALTRVGSNLALLWNGPDGDKVTLLSTQGEVGATAEISGRNFMGDVDGFVTVGDKGLCSYTTLLTEIGCNASESFSEHATLALDPSQIVVLSPYSPADAPWSSQGPKVSRFRRSNRTRLGADTRMAAAGNSQSRPALMYDPKRDAYFGAWIDDHLASTSPENDGGPTVRGTVIRSEGGTFGSSADFALSLPGAFSVGAPSATYDGSDIVLTWVERRDAEYRIMLSRVALSGAGAAVSASATIPVAVRTSPSVTRNAVIAADGSGYVISWSEGSSTSGHVMSVRVPKLATPEEIAKLAPLFLTPDENNRVRDQVATVFDGKQTIVVWRELGGASTLLYGVTFPDGANLPANPAFPIATGFSEKESLRLATDGKTGSLLVWADTVTLVRGIRGKFLSREPASEGEPAVKPLDPREGIPISQEIWDQANPSVAFSNDRASYFVTWSSREKGSDSALVGNYIALDGRVLEQPSPLVVSDTTAAAVANAGASNSRTPGENEDWPALATGPEATVGLIYNRLDSRSGYGAVRARFRSVVSGKLFAAECKDNSDCASRYCVSGVCCDTACADGCGTCGGATSPGAPSTAVKGMCSPLVSTTTCQNDERLICDGTSDACPRGCTSDAQCAAPGTCRDGQCTGATAVCADEFNVRTAEGDVSCGAYRCSEGTVFHGVQVGGRVLPRECVRF